MNILYHHRTQGTGAEGVHIAYIIKGLRDQGQQVVVVSPNRTEPSKTAGENPFAKKRGSTRGKLFDLITKTLPQFFFEILEASYSLLAFHKLKKVVCSLKIDFIYERHAFFMFAGALVSRLYRIPLIIEVNEIAGQARVRKQLFTGLAKKIERFVFRQASAIIVVSAFLKQKIFELDIPAQKIYILPNAADVELFDPDHCSNGFKKQVGLADHTLVVGFIGWFVGWHNLEILIQAFARSGASEDAVLMLVGEGTLKEKLRLMAKELGISHRLLLTGAVKYAEMPAVVKSMDVCVIPGANPYRSPIKMFEYMAMSKPVLAPDYEPITSIIENGADGLIFNPSDLDDLTRKLDMLIKDAQYRCVLGRNARKKILRCHKWIDNSRKILEIYYNATA